MKRRLPLILVAVVVVICVAAAAVAAVAAGVDGSPVAYRVNATEVSQTTVDHDLKTLADPDTAGRVKKVFGASPTTTDGAVSSTFTATWLDLQIRNQLLRQGAEQAKVTITARDREAERSVIDKVLSDNQLNFTIADLPAPLERALLDNYAYPAALGLDTQAKATAFFTAAVRRAHIAIDPRYGSWNPNKGVCPPTGCASSTTAGG